MGGLFLAEVLCLISPRVSMYSTLFRKLQYATFASRFDVRKHGGKKLSINRITNISPFFLAG
jgi:hypothetical protein